MCAGFLLELCIDRRDSLLIPVRAEDSVDFCHLAISDIFTDDASRHPQPLPDLLLCPAAKHSAVEAGSFWPSFSFPRTPKQWSVSHPLLQSQPLHARRRLPVIQVIGSWCLCIQADPVQTRRKSAPVMPSYGLQCQRIEGRASLLLGRGTSELF